MLTYSQQTKESSNQELSTLTEKMEEYKRQIDQQGRQCQIVNQDLSINDTLQSLSRALKPIEEVMQSSADGKVFIQIYFHVWDNL